jgi:hypothetical protein
MILADQDTSCSYCLCVRREIDGRTWTIYSGERIGDDRFVVGEPLFAMSDVARIIRLLKFFERQLGVPVYNIPSPDSTSVCDAAPWPRRRFGREV